MGQNQGKEHQQGGIPSKAKNRTVKHRYSTSSQAETENGGFTLPWDLRGGGTGNGPAVPNQGEDGNVTNFMRTRPLPVIPPEGPLLDDSNDGFEPSEINNAEMFYVQYDYDAGDNENQLSVYKGELIRLINYDDQKVWCEGQNKNGKIGWLPFAYVVAYSSFHKFDWYHGRISRNRAEYLLNSGINGSFLMRESESAPGQHSLSLRYDGRVYHYRVYFDDNDFAYVREEAKFKTLEELVAYHTEQAGGLVHNLRYSVSKVDKPPVYRFSPTEDEWEIPRMDVWMGQKLGGGQYGDVYKAEYKKYGVTVAVKTLKESHTDVDEFLKEAEMMKQIKHENLIKLIGVCTKETPIYIITEYMPKGNLLEYLRQADKVDLPAQTLLYMASQVSLAMKYLEAKNFIHRDLAARNCLVGENHLIKVADFGLARSVQQDYYKAHSGAKFPIKWTSPEALAYNKFSTKSDVWAFGILMWEIATYGMSPYPGRDLNQVYGLIDQGYRMECPDGCPEPAYTLMLDCWQWKAEDRPTFIDICYRLEHMLDVLDEEIKKSLKTRPLSMHSSDVEGMVLPPKPPKRKNNDKKDKEKDKYKTANADVAKQPVANEPVPAKSSGKVKKEKKEKTPIIPSMRNTLKKKTKKQQQQQEETTRDRSSESSASSDTGFNPSLPPPLPTQPPPAVPSLPPPIQSSVPQPIAKSMTISGSKISLNELQGGLKSLAKRRPEVAALNDNLTKTQEDSARRNSMGVSRPPPPPKPTDGDFVAVESSTLPRPRKPPLPPNRPLTSTRSTPTSSPTTVSNISPMLPVRNSPAPPPATEEKPAAPAYKPMLAARPSVKPRPSKPRPDIATLKQATTSATSKLTIDQSRLKPELVPISECLVSVYKVLKNLISLADLRQSENIREKTSDGTTGCTELVDRLSAYRDSIGPVARMKVNKHLTTIESSVNDFVTLSKDLPRIPTATDLEKISKTLSSLCTALEQLANALVVF